MFVKPAANPAFDDTAEESRANPRALLVYDPALRDYLPAYGRDVGADHDLYWHRRALAGEVTQLSAAEGNAALEAEAAGRTAAARQDAAPAKSKPAADAAAKEGK